MAAPEAQEAAVAPEAQAVPEVQADADNNDYLIEDNKYEIYEKDSGIDSSLMLKFQLVCSK